MSKPFITIVIDEGAGEARVVFHRRFRGKSDLWQADVLKDVLQQAVARYERSVGKWEHELEQLRPVKSAALGHS